MRDQQRSERHHGEEEAVEHHVGKAHLSQRDLAEEEAASPERTRQGTGGKAERTPLIRLGVRLEHPLTVAQTLGTQSIALAAQRLPVLRADMQPLATLIRL